MRKSEFEEVFSYDWYDGPISGVANKNGKPCFFEYQGYNESGKESFYLTPIENEILPIVIESWQIWKRWDIAFHKGKVEKETHPFLPNDKKRGEELSFILDRILKVDELNFVELGAEFKQKENQRGILGMKKLIVKWTKK